MSILRCSGLLILAVAMLGCKGRGIALPTAPVSGTVTYRGKPLGFGKITFFHSSGHAAGGEIAANGSFVLTAYQGNNHVAIECFDVDRPGSTKTRSRTTIDKSLVPDRYMNYGTSGLTFEVAPGANNKAEFALKD